MLKEGDKVYYVHGITQKPVEFGKVVRTTKTLAVLKTIYNAEFKLTNTEVYGGYFRAGSRYRHNPDKFFLVTPEIEREIEADEFRNHIISRITKNEKIDISVFLNRLSDKALLQINGIMNAESEG